MLEWNSRQQPVSHYTIRFRPFGAGFLPVLAEVASFVSSGLVSESKFVSTLLHTRCHVFSSVILAKLSANRRQRPEEDSLHLKL